MLTKSDVIITTIDLFMDNFIVQLGRASADQVQWSKAIGSEKTEISATIEGLREANLALETRVKELSNVEKQLQELQNKVPAFTSFRLTLFENYKA